MALALCNFQKLGDGEPFGAGPSGNAEEDFGGAAPKETAEDKPLEDDDLGF